MPPVVVAAGIGAAAIGGSAAISSSATKKASKASATATAQGIAAQEANRDYQYNLNAPTINQGQDASNLYGDFLGVNGTGAAQGALDTYRGSTGYQDLLNTGLGAVNSNAYARGMGDSGATLKALQTRGMNLADQSSGTWLTGLGNLASRGDQARGLVAGVGSNTVNSNNALLQNNASNVGNAALANAGQINGSLQNLLNLGGSLYGSSYNGSTINQRKSLF